MALEMWHNLTRSSSVGLPKTEIEVLVMSVHTMLLGLGLSPLDERQGRLVLHRNGYNQYIVQYTSPTARDMRIQMTATPTVRIHTRMHTCARRSLCAWLHALALGVRPCTHMCAHKR